MKDMRIDTCGMCQFFGTIDLCVRLESWTMVMTD